MMQKQEKSYGTWPLPYSVGEIFSSADQVLFPRLYQGTLYWMERRETGETTVSSTQEKDLLPPEYAARSEVHGYGGIAYLPSSRGLVFSNAEDQKLYVLEKERCVPLSQMEGARYADGCYDPTSDAFYYVREHRTQEGEKSMVVLLARGEELVVASGYEFYSHPRCSPDGKFLACLAWNLPYMPWQRASLLLYKKEGEGRFVLERKIGSSREAIFQPEFAEDGTLYFLSDRSGYANLYRYCKGVVARVTKGTWDLARAPWVFGLDTYGFLQERKEKVIVSILQEKGSTFLGKICLKTGSLEKCDFPFSGYTQITVEGGQIYALATHEQNVPALIKIKKASFTYPLGRPKAPLPSGISNGERIVFSTRDAQECFGLFYLPSHPQYLGDPGAKPPLLVKVHSGPTSMHEQSFSYETQFWTSQGFAYLVVNYRGSTGFGKRYREALDGFWGIRDVEDCIDGALYLVDKGRVDPKRMAIRGSSSGGFTALSAAREGVFQAVVSYYGIADLEELSSTTHRFERGYNETLIGPYPKQKQVYQERSPLHHAARMGGSILLFHGEKDLVVPSTQSQSLYEALKKEGKDVELHLFAEEGHGFRKPATKQSAWEIERSFYQRVFGLAQGAPDRKKDFSPSL